MKSKKLRDAEIRRQADQTAQAVGRNDIDYGHEDLPRPPAVSSMLVNPTIVEHPWEQEEWYREQTQRWSALLLCGWQFIAPPTLPHSVGITMLRERDSFTLYETTGDAKAVHTRLLERCEYHAAEGT